MKLGILVICTLGVAGLAQEPMNQTRQTKAVQLTLNDTMAAALENNPAIKTARAKSESARQRIPQTAAVEDPKLSFNSLPGRFVAISPDTFTDQMPTVDQSIPP